jgi:Ca2+-binding RTX toxin-like protein
MATFYGTEDRDEITDHTDLTAGVTSDPPGLLRTTDEADLIFGYGGNDLFYGGGGHDTMYGGDGGDGFVDDVAEADGSDVYGEAGNDHIYSGSGVSHLDGGGGRDTLFGQGDLIGGTGKDNLYGGGLLFGGAGDDYLWAHDTDDLLRGGAGEDLLIGNGGQDTLIGGAGDDAFYFYSPAGYPSSSDPGAPDLIRAEYRSAIPAFEGSGVAGGDSIDLHDIDPDPATIGDQAFIYGGRGAGHVWLGENGSRTLILANLDADAAPELKVAIADGAVRASDYAAGDFIL